MKVRYQYNSPSICIQKGNLTTLGLSPDVSRDEQVSFLGRVKAPLVFRDALLMLREIVISDASVKKKERTDFFNWLEGEIDRRIRAHEQYLPHVRQDLEEKINALLANIAAKDARILEVEILRTKLKKEIDSFDSWQDYYKLERKFWSFIRHRDLDLWMVLDPVITVHPDQVSFEAFSIDESIYGCMSVDMAAFDLLQPPVLGTTNIDFSLKLAREMERFRTYSAVELSVNPGGFTVDIGAQPAYTEKKIDLPETWVKGFNQVSAAAFLDGVTLTLPPVDIYDICAFLRRHKERESPRYMQWFLEKDKPVRIVFEPFGTELTLKTIYHGDKKREEKIWGRRRWLVLEKLIPLAQSFNVKLLGFGMPQFVTADMGSIKMTVGFSAWSANDWVKGTAFNIMSGFIGDGNYSQVYNLLKEKRSMAVDDIIGALNAPARGETISGIGSLLKRGEGYFDPVSDTLRFRKLINGELPTALYETTPTEIKVKSLIDAGMEHFTMALNDDKTFIFKNTYTEPNPHYLNPSYKQKSGYDKQFIDILTALAIDEDGQISHVKCTCKEFNKGPRNISAPCPHILALYMVSARFTRLSPKPGRVYKTNDIMEMLL